MTTYFLATPGGLAPPPVEVPRELWNLVLESMDGSKKITLDGSGGWTHMPGSQGLELPPVEVVTEPIPGVDGSVVQDVRVVQREVFLPLFVDSGGTRLQQTYRMDELRSLVDPMTGQFRIVSQTERGERELVVVYKGGLEGDDSPERAGLGWNKVGLTAVATDPYALSRTERVVEFTSGAAVAAPFLGVEGGTDAPWPGMLGTTAVIGSDMRVFVTSEVPVYPKLELTGPMDSFLGTMTPESGGEIPNWTLSIPLGVPAGQVLVVATDPRARSIRLNGVAAAGRVARGSTLRPFMPGLNTLDVTAPGGTDATRVRLSWREKFRSLW